MTTQPRAYASLNPSETAGPFSPSSTAKPILQSMAGNSIQAVTKDEWGPPADRKKRVNRPVGRGGRKTRAFRQIPTVGHDYHGHLGLIWRVAGLQKDCFKVKVSCREKAVISKTRAPSRGLPQPRPHLQL